MKLYWYLVKRNYDGKHFAMRGNTKPNNWYGLSGLFAFTEQGYCFDTPFGSVRNTSNAEYDPSFYTVVNKVETKI